MGTIFSCALLHIWSSTLILILICSYKQLTERAGNVSDAFILKANSCRFPFHVERFDAAAAERRQRGSAGCRDVK